ncbi:cocosin 1-like [Tasmannia lanceolata]|uniref:cocosin 1-like n=1 Tax=Tasmannia lanceolata TaxID=3420 RepID=UPI004062FD4A
MATSFFPLLALCLFFFHGSLGQIEMRRGQFQQGQQRRFRDQSECRIQSLSALEPNRRVEAEAGVTESWDENNEQLDCAGVAATRYTIEPKGLLLPFFSNAPKLVYIEQGRGISGVVIPGCPESFQDFQQSQQSEQERGQRNRDQHQRVQQFRQGDILALPAGVSHWCYNDGETPVVAVVVYDTSSYANQLDRNLRRFQLAGRGQYQSEQAQQYKHEPTRRESSGYDNIWNGLDTQTIAEALNVPIETARKLQSQDDRRGNIVRVENGLHLARPPRREEDEEREERRRPNGLEETFCNMRLKENIADPTQADVYSGQGGRITTLNSNKLPILEALQLSAERGVLYRSALLAPQWNMNAHSVVYVTRGNGRIQIVGHQGNSVFDGELHQGQLVIVPQMFTVVKQAGDEGFEWVAFKTNDNAMQSPLVGKASALRGMPEEVIMNAYRISRDEARRLKYNRDQEMQIFSPSRRSRSQGWGLLAEKFF